MAKIDWSKIDTYQGDWLEKAMVQVYTNMGLNYYKEMAKVEKLRNA